MTVIQEICIGLLIMLAVAFVWGRRTERHSGIYDFKDGFFMCLGVELVILLVAALFLGAVGVIG